MAGARPDRPLLARSQLLARIPREELRAMLAASSERSFRAGEALFQRGDVGDGLYAIASGAIRVVLVGPDGGEVTVAVLAAGDVLGELSLFDGAPRSATAIASEDVRALHVPAERFQAWLAAHPSAAVPMLSELARRLRRTDEQLGELALLDVETRLARWLWHRLAPESPGAPIGARLRVNQRELASMLGATRESVNKQLARLKAQGLITVGGGYVTLVDPAGLRGRADLL